jgi:membrane protein
MLLNKLKAYFGLLQKTFALFSKNNGLKLSASLSFYTVFCLCPFLIVIISLAGLFYGREAVQGKVYAQIKGLVGSDAASQIQQIILNLQKTHHTVPGSIIGFIVLLIGASGVFSEIQSSINYVWEVKNKPGPKGWMRLVINNLLSFSLLAGVAFILLVSLTVNALIDVLSERLKTYFPDYIVYVFYAMNIIFICLVITILFAIIFKVLPNALIKWKDAIRGASFTALLFLLGKFLIGFYLGNSSIGATYGATASIVIVMLWVYYSSIILYFGSSFTKIYMLDKGRSIEIKKGTKEISSK